MSRSTKQKKNNLNSSNNKIILFGQNKELKESFIDFLKDFLVQQVHKNLIINEIETFKVELLSLYNLTNLFDLSFKEIILEALDKEFSNKENTLFLRKTQFLSSLISSSQENEKVYTLTFNDLVSKEKEKYFNLLDKFLKDNDLNLYIQLKCVIITIRHLNFLKNVYKIYV
ncbi:MAG: hypothetical protein NZZ41_04295 [Candidatus Dojkabacteria bacterium]|nr:hypothetical protein [Candidatus Dojkabacteria bacterium]